MRELQLYPCCFLKRILTFNKKEKNPLFHKQMETKGEVEILDKMFLHTICKIPSCCRLLLSLMQRLRTAILSYINCDQFQWDFEQTSNLTTCQNLFHRISLVIVLSTLLPPSYRRQLNSCTTTWCNADTAARALIVLN